MANRVILEIDGVRYERKKAEYGECTCSRCSVCDICDKENEALCCNFRAYFVKLEEDGTV